MLPFARIAIIGLGLLGSSIARAVSAAMPNAVMTGFDADPETRERARALGLVADISDTAGAAVTDADLVILCVPVGAMGEVAAQIAPDLPADALVSDVGSSKAHVLAALTAALPNHHVIPAHPVAGTERSGPEAGFASLFQNRWWLLTPAPEVDPVALTRLEDLLKAMGAKTNRMEPAHHDQVLAVVSHTPHLIAYTMVGVADDLGRVTDSEVIKYSAAGFRDFTRIAASDPTMWRDVFLNNKEAVLQMLQRFTEDLTALQRAIRVGDSDTLFDHFTRTRAIRRGIIEAGQDTSAPDFGRGAKKD